MAPTGHRSAAARTTIPISAAARAACGLDCRDDVEDAAIEVRDRSASAEWTSVGHQLVALARTPAPVPQWWSPQMACVGSVETQSDPGPVRPPESLVPGSLYLTLALAGWGSFQTPDAAPRKLNAGTVSVSNVPSPHRHFVPAESPGWTFAWLAINHSYLVSRISAQVGATGPIISIEPRGPLAASVLRLVRGAIKKDFRDRFDAELAQIDFALALERWAQIECSGRPEVQRLTNEVRSLVVAKLPQAIGVDSLAAEFRMSRSHFSCYFRERTGLTPSHFATEVRLQEAMRRLRQTTAPLKSIAFDCGFASTNHFCKVFRRFVHASPTVFRQLSQSDSNP